MDDKLKKIEYIFLFTYNLKLYMSCDCQNHSIVYFIMHKTDIINIICYLKLLLEYCYTLIII